MGGDYVHNTRHDGGMVGWGGDYVHNTRRDEGMVGREGGPMYVTQDVMKE